MFSTILAQFFLASLDSGDAGASCGFCHSLSNRLAHSWVEGT